MESVTKHDICAQNCLRRAKKLKKTGGSTGNVGFAGAEMSRRHIRRVNCERTVQRYVLNNFHPNSDAQLRATVNVTRGGTNSGVTRVQ